VSKPTWAPDGLDVLALAFDHSPVAMCVTVDGRITTSNRRLGELLGCTHLDLVGRSLADCGGPSQFDVSPGVLWTFQNTSLAAYGLTPREREIASHLTAGSTSREIALAMGISARTVEAHRSRLIRKLDAANQRQLVARLVAQGCLAG
jgi:DNA-binding CsgD family transcriptional regulator